MPTKSMLKKIVLLSQDNYNELKNANTLDSDVLYLTSVHDNDSGGGDAIPSAYKYMPIYKNASFYYDTRFQQDSFLLDLSGKNPVVSIVGNVIFDLNHTRFNANSYAIVKSSFCKTFYCVARNSTVGWRIFLSNGDVAAGGSANKSFWIGIDDVGSYVAGASGGNSIRNTIDGRQYHVVAATRESDSYSFFINGNLIGSKKCEDFAATFDGNIGIGTLLRNKTATFMTGSSDIRFCTGFQTIHSHAEIQTNSAFLKSEYIDNFVHNKYMKG